MPKKKIEVEEEVDLEVLRKEIDKLDKNKKIIAISLLNRMIYLNNKLIDLEKQIDAEGVVTSMCQGKYDINRQNPAFQAYTAAMKLYLNAVKQMLEITPEGGEQSDGFEDF